MRECVHNCLLLKIAFSKYQGGELVSHWRLEGCCPKISIQQFDAKIHELIYIPWIDIKISKLII